MIYRFGAFELDDAAGELRRRGEAVRIQPKPLALLVVLVEERHRIVPNEELLERLWPDEVVTPNSLNRAVSLARSAIGDSGSARFIRSYVKRGYRFQGPVVELDDAGTAEPSGAAPDALEDGLPFVGREDAAARLAAAWQRAAKGRGGVSVVSGPAGIGKTRLVEVFARDVDRRGGLVLRGRALEEEGEPAFWVWAQVLRALRDAQPKSLDVPGLADSGELAALMPELPVSDDAAAVRLPAEQRRFVFFDAVARTLRLAARTQPLLVVFEDLHWSDPASLRLFEHLAFEVAGAPLLLVATARDEPGGDTAASRTLAALRRQEHFQRVALEPLSGEAIERFVEQSAGRRLPELARQLRARTGGVPLFVREAMRRLGESGALEGSGPIEVDLPAARIDWVGDALRSLSDACASLLQTASTVGREFPLPLVADVSGTPRDVALDLLDEAIRCGVVEPEPRPRYRFSHDLFREAAYDGLASGARVRLHHRVALQLEKRHAGELDRVASELAHHWHRSLPVGSPERAFDGARRAAGLAFEACAYEKAALHWRQAIEALDHYETAEPVLRLEALLGLGEASRLAGDRGRRREHFGEALALARSLDRDEDLAAAAIGLCDVVEWGVRDDVARTALLEALERTRPGSELEARIRTRLGYLEALGDREQAEPHLRRAVRIARELGASDPLEEALYALHFALGGPDDKRERVEILDELRGAASAARDPVASVIAVLDVACDQLELGDASAAERLRREADATAGHPPHPRTLWHRLVYDTGLALMQGRLDEVEGRAEEARALGLRIQHPYARACHGAHLAGLREDRGDAEGVLAQFEPILPVREGPLEWVKARVARARLAVGREAEARDLFGEIMDAGLERIPRNLRWISTLVEIAHCAADLGEASAAHALVRALAPFEAHHAVLPMVICYGGPASWALARLQELRARADEADALYREALEAVERLGARPAQAHILLSHGSFLRRRQRRSDSRERLCAAAALAADLGMRRVERVAAEKLDG